jgi:hypothetical protein
MTLFDGRAPRSAVMKLRESRSFVAIRDNTEFDLHAWLAGHVVPNRSCTPERLRT